MVFDIKKAEVGVRYRVVEDDYGIRQLIPIDVPVYKEVGRTELFALECDLIQQRVKLLVASKHNHIFNDNETRLYDLSKSGGL